MTGFWCFLLGVSLASGLRASPLADPYVRNLTLVGVIHVEGSRAKGQSVAVLHDRFTGKTRILHKGDRLTDSNLELRDLAPQQVTLARGSQTFVLRVESSSETSAMTSQVESTSVELVEPKTVKENEPQVETKRLEPDPDCVGEECPALTE